MTLDKQEWTKMLTERGFLFRENQYQFYKRQSEFLKTNFDIQINQGGMGLGKTFCNAEIISGNKHQFDNIFIATPTITLKHEWSNELNNWPSIKNNYVEWVSKQQCCGIYHSDVSKCDDDCKHNEELWTNGEPKDLCYDMLDSLKFPLEAKEYYEKFGISSCLRYPILLGLKTKPIIVGDFFGFLNRKMWGYTVGTLTHNSYLIIDEAHLIPSRAIGFLSRDLRLRKTIEGLDRLLVGGNNSTLENTLELLIALLEKLITNIKSQGKKPMPYTFDDFCNGYYLIEKEKKSEGYAVYSLSELREFLIRFSSEDEEIQKETNPARKFVRFLDFWERYGTGEDYNPFFSYIKNFKDKKEEIELKVICANPANYLKEIWKEWAKISLVSGTVDKEYFSNTLGLENFKVKFEEELKSYGIRDNVIVYPYGDFTAGKDGLNRDKTLQEQSIQFNKSLEELEGRTLVFALSKDMAFKVERLIDKNKVKVINFAKNEKNEEVSQSDYEKLKKEFGKLSCGVAIINILGRVEGQNFLDINNQPIKNVIIYGYPFQKRGIEFDFVKTYWENKLINQEKAKEYAEFFPVSSKIYQSAMRSKRDEKHNPIIILWGSPFKEGSRPYKYLSKELMGKQIKENELIYEIKKRQSGNKDS